MPAPSIYRSTDVGAPALYGGVGSLVVLLDACLVNGYGSTFATGTITNDGTAPADGDTVTIGSVTYTFRTASLVGQPANALAIGGTGTQAFASLHRAITQTGTAGADYSTGTTAHPDVWSSSALTPTTVTARKGGTAGNAIALSRAAAGTPHFTVSGATLTGGGGTDSRASLGWTRPFSGVVGQAIYRQGSSGFYLQVDDTGPGAAFAREARCSGWEAMTAWNTGTGQFPLSSQSTALIVARKSNSLDGVVRPWILIGDDRTFYLLVQSGDATGNYVGTGFGDFYSFVAGDAFKCMIMGAGSESSTSTHIFAQQMAAQTGNLGGHFLARNFSGVGGSTAFIKFGDGSLMGTTQANWFGAMMFPNGSDGGLYLAPARIVDGSTPGLTISGSINLRGRLRGFYHAPYAVASFADGDTFSGSGEYAGRTFIVVKPFLGTTSSAGVIPFETTAWDTST